jgi:hypothetical protein
MMIRILGNLVTGSGANVLETIRENCPNVILAFNRLVVAHELVLVKEYLWFLGNYINHDRSAVAEMFEHQLNIPSVFL